ncbi:tripartite tricarboxylate transporter TctB family protein [Pseudomonas akapageensis]|uniref:tripartite tricarboxylate transporter TctB family protein n=1 Tax=Pseudomonas akapageensis TaxID=2609961 RepID=UPI0014076B1F|nr:tripartite tricarboxylate transporter TctB family protein [Pseudomonas akapageensis]
MSTSTSALVGTRWVELGLALFTAALGGVVMYGSASSGIGWDDAGPQAGYFPFYIGLLMSAASLTTVLITFLQWRRLSEAFVSREAFNRVLKVFVPIVLFVASMPLIGLYLASAGFIAWFMWRDRQRPQPYGWMTIVAVAGGAALASYLIFALWFKVPLDAGPLGDLAALARRMLK